MKVGDRLNLKTEIGMDTVQKKTKSFWFRNLAHKSVMMCGLCGIIIYTEADELTQGSSWREDAVLLDHGFDKHYEVVSIANEDDIKRLNPKNVATSMNKAVYNIGAAPNFYDEAKTEFAFSEEEKEKMREEVKNKMFEDMLKIDNS